MATIFIVYPLPTGMTRTKSSRFFFTCAYILVKMVDNVPKQGSRPVGHEMGSLMNPVGKMNRTIELYPRKSRTVSPETFLGLSAEEKANVTSVRFIAPKLGDKHFGKVVLTYRTARFSR